MVRLLEPQIESFETYCADSDILFLIHQLLVKYTPGTGQGLNLA